MSETGNQAVVAATEAQAALVKLNERFEKKGKVVALATDTASYAAFPTLVDSVSHVKDEAGNDIPNPKLFDWTAKAPEGFDHFALVKVTDEDAAHVGELRLIAIANIDTALADAVVRNKLYSLYLNRVVNAAQDDEAEEADFILPGGTFKLAFAEDAFNATQGTIKSALTKQGVAGVSKSALKQAFSNAAIAESLFPRVKPEYWVKIIGVARAMAVKAGLDVSLFDYWLQTRDARTDTGPELELDLGKLEVAAGIGATADTQATPASA